MGFKRESPSDWIKMNGTYRSTKSAVSISLTAGRRSTSIP